MAYRIEFNRDDCIGCGTCAALCDNWEIDSEGKAHPKQTVLEDIGCNKDAEENCPASCIKIVEE